MDEARKALKELSRDREALFAAQDRVLAEMAYRASLEEARSEGVDAGLRQALEGLLVKRFGPLPPSASERLDAATAEELQRLIVGVVDAVSLEEALTGASGSTSG